MGARYSIGGVSGSGKSTLGREVARLLNVPYVELDALVHGPNWTEATADELRSRIEAATAGVDGWVVDGNYRGKIGNYVLRRADTFVWLDLPLTLCLTRVLRRSLRRILRREQLWNGNRESFRNTFFARDALLVWAIRQHHSNKTKIPRYIVENAHLDVVHLRSPREVQRWLAALYSSPSK